MKEVTKTEQTFRSLTIVFENTAEYCMFIKALAKCDQKGTIAARLFQQEYEEILTDEKLQKVYDSIA